jgi:hypothetical protein
MAIAKDSAPAAAIPIAQSAAVSNQWRGADGLGAADAFGSGLLLVGMKRGLDLLSHYKKWCCMPKSRDGRALLPLARVSTGVGLGNCKIARKPSAFGNVQNNLKQKKPLRDKELTDSIQVIS